MLWHLIALKPFPHLGVQAHEVIAIDATGDPVFRVVGKNARPLPTDYGALSGGVEEGVLVPLTQQETAAHMTHLGRRAHLHLVKEGAA